jgi:hypothetical protein
MLRLSGMGIGRGVSLHALSSLVRFYLLLRCVSCCSCINTHAQVSLLAIHPPTHIVVVVVSLLLQLVRRVAYRCCSTHYHYLQLVQFVTRNQLVD